MSFLSSVREAASAGLKMAASMASGTSLPFEQGPQITSYQGVMKMYSGKRENKEGVKEIVSIFMYDLKNKKSDEELALVKNAQRRLRTIKHPYLLRCIDAGEQLDNKGGGIIWIVTEPVQPLEDVIDNLREAPGSIAWGTYTLAAAIKFLNIDCNIVHGQVCMSSLFVDKGMDWKLGGFELLVTAPEANPAYFARAKDVLPKRYQSPEISRGQPEQLEALQRIPVAADWWALGCTVFEVWCGTIKSPSDLKNMSGMPEALRPDFVRMLQSSPAGRLRPAELLSNPVFEDDYVSLHIFLETLNVKDAIEKDRFFTKLAERVPALPKPAAQWKVLPALNNSLEFGGGSARALEPLLKIANVLSEEEYQEQVVPTIIKLFANTDRQMRLPLLERLPSMVEHLSKKVINESIFQPLAMGFVDTSVILREMTVKSIVTIAPKLSSGTMQHVMRAFAKLQLDEEAAIRTNTTICLGKIAAHIDAQTREKQYHSPMDVATKIVPNVAPMVLDVEKDVREAALACMRIYMQRLEHAAQQLSLPPEQRKELQAPEQKTPDLSDPAAAVSWLTSTVTNAVKEAVKEQTGGSAPKAAAGSAAGAPAGYGTGGPGAA
ncbi:n-terminal kinase-like protein, partial [Chrysochromulina tobinii]